MDILSILLLSGCISFIIYLLIEVNLIKQQSYKELIKCEHKFDNLLDIVRELENSIRLDLLRLKESQIDLQELQNKLEKKSTEGIIHEI